MTSVSFTVRGEPVPCGRARVFSAGGRAIATTPPKTRAYERLVGIHALGARPFGWREDWAAYELHIQVFRAERRGDGDNYAKAIADGCKGVLWANDAAITRWIIDIVDDLETPRVEVRAVMLGERDLDAERKARTKALAAKGKATKAARQMGAIR